MMRPCDKGAGSCDWLQRQGSSPDPKASKGGARAWTRWRSAELRRAPLLVVLVASLVLNSLLLTRPRRESEKHCPALALRPSRSNASDLKGPLMIGGEKCSTPSLEALRQHMGNVVLIININYDFVAYNTSSFLREVYGRFFHDVVFIGPNNIPEIGVSARAHSPWKNRWCYSYYYFPTIVARYPNADGYLWMNDDVVLNYWQLLGADKTKLWLPDTPTCWKPEKDGCSGDVKEPERCRCQGTIPFTNSGKASIADGWSGTLWHRKLVRQAWGSLDRAFKDQHIKSVNSTALYHKRVVDIFYVPRRLSMSMAFKLMPSFVEAAVWSEVAVPMMFHALEDPSNFDPIFSRMVYRWERRKDYNPLEYWNSSMSAFHHWKLASSSGKAALLNAFKPQDPCLEVLLAKIEGRKSTPPSQGLLSQGTHPKAIFSK